MDYSILGGVVYEFILKNGIIETMQNPIFKEAIISFEKLIYSSKFSFKCLSNLTEEQLKFISSPFLECIYLFVNKRTVDGYLCSDLLSYISLKCQKAISFLYMRNAVSSKELIEVACRTNDNILFDYCISKTSEIYKNNDILELCCRKERTLFVALILEKKYKTFYEYCKNYFSAEYIRIQTVKLMDLQACFNIACKRNNQTMIKYFRIYDPSLVYDEKNDCDRNLNKPINSISSYGG